MKIYIPGLNKEGIGGGNTFIANFARSTTLQFQDQIEGAERMFVPNPMWAERADFEKARDLRIPIILRLDNIPEDWNNRGTAISKLKDFISWSDCIIYQSDWAEEKYKEFIKANKIISFNLSGPGQIRTIIHNGVDTDLFSPSGDNLAYLENPVILFVKSSRNENKRYPEGMEIFRRYYAHNPNSKLLLVGKFGEDLHKYNFGFYNGENYEYLGLPPHEKMPEIYRSADILLFPAYADCAPNTVLEAMSCGIVPIINPYGGGIEFTQGMRYGVNLSNQENISALITQALTYSRLAIRDHVVKNFNLKDMIKKYQEVIYA